MAASLPGSVRGALDVMSGEVFDGTELGITRGFNNTNVLDNFGHAAQILGGQSNDSLDVM